MNKDTKESWETKFDLYWSGNCPEYQMFQKPDENDGCVAVRERIKNFIRDVVDSEYRDTNWQQSLNRAREKGFEEGRREERERIYKEAAIISQQFIDSDSSVEAGKRYIYDLGNLLGHLTDKDKTHE